MKVLLINTTNRNGSTGRIVSGLKQILSNDRHESIVAFGRGNITGSLSEIKIGNNIDLFFSVLLSRLFDRHGFSSKHATMSAINKIIKFDPDIIHLHNLHGYYFNIELLFKYLKKAEKPILWTLHDCWPFTGHCSHFDWVNCFRWKTECHHCPNKHGYPASWLIDNSHRNFRKKKELFTGLEKMILVAPCSWMEGHLRNSFLSGYDIRVIYNGIDTYKFKPVDSEEVRKKYGFNKKYILGVANIWTQRKGLEDFIKLRKLLDKDTEIILVGLNRYQCKCLPEGIKGIMRTENTDELAALYSGAEVFVNPTYADNFPSVNLEALACGTPVATYNTGGSPETIDEETGRVVKKGDIRGLAASIYYLMDMDINKMRHLCRNRATKLYDSNVKNNEYLLAYKEVLCKY